MIYRKSCNFIWTHCYLFRSSHRRRSVKKSFLRNFAKFTEKHLSRSLSFNKVAGLRAAALLKERLWHGCFPVSFAKFLTTLFLQNTSSQLLSFVATIADFWHASIRIWTCVQLKIRYYWIKLLRSDYYCTTTSPRDLLNIQNPVKHLIWSFL